MGWLQRMFGMEQSEDIQVNPEPQTYEDDNGGATRLGQS
jgi:hypothetical protein